MMDVIQDTRRCIVIKAMQLLNIYSDPSNASDCESAVAFRQCTVSSSVRLVPQYRREGSTRNKNTFC